jgi:hypothetical protein
LALERELKRAEWEVEEYGPQYPLRMKLQLAQQAFDYWKVKLDMAQQAFDKMDRDRHRRRMKERDALEDPFHGLSTDSDEGDGGVIEDQEGDEDKGKSDGVGDGIGGVGG